MTSLSQNELIIMLHWPSIWSRQNIFINDMPIHKCIAFALAFSYYDVAKVRCCLTISKIDWCDSILTGQNNVEYWNDLLQLMLMWVSWRNLSSLDQSATSSSLKYMTDKQAPTGGVRFIAGTGPWFNIKMSSYQYRKSYCGDKTILRPSYLHNGISYTGKTTSLYWIGALMLFLPALLYMSLWHNMLKNNQFDTAKHQTPHNSNTMTILIWPMPDSGISILCVFVYLCIRVVTKITYV